MAVQFFDSLDVNSNKITELANGTNPTDAINLSQLTAASVVTFKQTFGDGVLTTFTFTHNFNTLDFVARVTLVATGEAVQVNLVAATVNTATLTLPVAPSLNQLRVVLVKAP